MNPMYLHIAQAVTLIVCLLYTLSFALFVVSWVGKEKDGMRLSIRCWPGFNSYAMTFCWGLFFFLMRL